MFKRISDCWHSDFRQHWELCRSIGIAEVRCMAPSSKWIGIRDKQVVMIRDASAILLSGSGL